MSDDNFAGLKSDEIVGLIEAEAKAFGQYVVGSDVAYTDYTASASINTDDETGDIAVVISLCKYTECVGLSKIKIAVYTAKTGQKFIDTSSCVEAVKGCFYGDAGGDINGFSTVRKDIEDLIEALKKLIE